MMADWTRIRATAIFGMAVCAFFYINDDNPNDWIDQLMAEDKAMPATELVVNGRRAMEDVMAIAPQFTHASQNHAHLKTITSVRDHPLSIYVQHAEHRYDDVINKKAYTIACGGQDVSDKIRTLGDYKIWRAKRLRTIDANNKRTISNNANILTYNQSLDDGEEYKGKLPKPNNGLSSYNARARAYNRYVKKYNADLSAIDGQKTKETLSYRIPRSSAYSAYQFVGETMDGLQEYLSLPDSFELTPDNIDGMFMYHLIRKLKYNDFLHGDISVEDFATALAKEWAGIPLRAGIKNHRGIVSKHGESYYAGYNGNSASSDMTYEGLIETLYLVLKLHNANKFQFDFQSSNDDETYHQHIGQINTTHSNFLSLNDNAQNLEQATHSAPIPTPQFENLNI